MADQIAVLDPGKVTPFNRVDGIDDILSGKFTDDFLFIIPDI